MEVWPIAADETAIYLVSGNAPWRQDGPTDSDKAPHWEVESILRDHVPAGRAALLQSTSWRFEEPHICLTYVAVINLGGDYVRAEWPRALPVTPKLLEEVGKPSQTPPTEAPLPRNIDVLMHALRHLKFLADTDAAARTALDEHWHWHLDSWKPGLAGLYRPDLDEPRQ